MAESAKDFIKGTLGKINLKGALAYMALGKALGQGFSIWGVVRRTNPHYVHYNTTRVSLESDVPADLQSYVVQLEDETQDLVRDWNRDLTRELEAELEYAQSDNYIADMLDANDRYFDDETGDEVDMSQYLSIDQLPYPVQQRVLQDFAELFDREPKQIFQSLVQRKVLFDKRGNRADTSHAMRVSQLEPKLKGKVLDKFRHWGVEDELWAEAVVDSWKERLAERGFARVEIAYSLGGGQGDGASFTADAIDGLKLLKWLLHRQEHLVRVNYAVRALVG